MDDYATDPSWEDTGDGKSRPGFPIADIVSLRTVVNILIRKGICTPEELYEEEQRVRGERKQARSAPIVQTTRPGEPPNGEPHKRKASWLKRKMSKRRWTRRLGTRLFGWQWKKVKTSKGETNFDHNEADF